MTLTTYRTEFVGVDNQLCIGKVHSHAHPTIGLLWYATILAPEATNRASFRQAWTSRGHLTEKLAKRALQRQLRGYRNS